MNNSTSLSDKSGMSPGSLIHISDIEEQLPQISITQYDKESDNTFLIETSDELLPLLGKNNITWIQIDGLKNIEFLKSIGEIFKIHPLILEDILNTNQRAKFEDNDEYQYMVLKCLSQEHTSKRIAYEQISILHFKDVVFTFKEKRDDLFNPIHKRIKKSKSRIRTMETDYLVYSILDIIIDQNFIVIEALDDTIDSIEEEVLLNPDIKTLIRLQDIKKDLIHIRRSTTPHRELINGIIRSESTLIKESTTAYFKDVYDHVLRVSENIELQRDMVYSLMDMYQTSISNKMNETMKILTIFASIFIPLTFIAGVYGMNFEHMPELKWKYAYPILWVVFIIIAAGLLMYFRKKKWL